MVLIRLCHVSDLPPPGDLVRRLAPASASTQAAGARRAAFVRRRSSSGRRWRHRIRCRTRPPRRGWRAFATSPRWWPSRREAMLHAHLIHSVHLVRFAPPVIELRPQPEAPKDLAVAARRAADRGNRHPLDHRAVHRRGRADRRRTGQRRRCRAPDGRGRSSAGARDHGRVALARESTRCTTRQPTPMVCQQLDAEAPDVDADTEPSDEMEFDE